MANKKSSKKIEKTKYDSYVYGSLCKGCKKCVKGSKEVIFITGICPRKCFFCPISDVKNQKDIVYANEWKINSFKDVITEAKAIDAKGAGITGGDPLCRIDRTIEYIKGLKKEFGKKFHIHLYTSLNLVNLGNLKLLYKSGLDEIRFHLDLESDKLWDRLNKTIMFKWNVGVEIPVLPDKLVVIKNIVDYINNINKNNKRVSQKVFLNLNELEISDNSFHNISGLKTKNKLSYAVKGSESIALKALNYAKENDYDINIHYCTAKLKDAHQLANRLKRRAKNVATDLDILDEEGMLIRGAIYLSSLKPDFDYRKKLEKMNQKQRKNILIKLEKFKVLLMSQFDVMGIRRQQVLIDEHKLRLLVSLKLLVDNEEIISFIKDKGFEIAIVKEYPTYDMMEVEVDFL